MREAEANARRHHRAIYNFCFRRVGHWGLAEVLTSAVFAEAWRRRAEARAGSMVPWLYGLATVLTRSHRPYQEAAEQVPPPAGAGAARADAERQVAQLRTAMRHFRQRDVDILDLAATRKVTIPEIASILSLRPVRVKARLLRARQRLARAGIDPQPPLTDLPLPAERIQALLDGIGRSTGTPPRRGWPIRIFRSG